MPVMNGYEATKAYRQYEADHNLERIPIIGISANDVIAVRQLCLDAGMDEFLPKPFSLKELTFCLLNLHLLSNV
jgi:CheY-like chemotaxis protein